MQKNLAICSLASGSSGNCYVVRTDSTAILVDAGISYKQIRLGLESLGIDPSEINAVLVTHEHSDHIKGLPTLTKQTGVKIYASSLTAELVSDDPENIECFEPGESFKIGDILVNSFPVSHDAAQPVGYSLSCGEKNITLVTDTGIVTEEMKAYMKRSDVLVLESNHDVNVLRMGHYPWFLKQRILSDRGHLSNEAAANALAELLKEDADSGCRKERMVLLAHLSKENNFPEMAIATMENILQENGFTIGRDARVTALARTAMSPEFES